MKNTPLIVLLISSLILAACAGNDEPTQAEAVPPTRMEASPLGSLQAEPPVLSLEEAAPEGPAASGIADPPTPATAPISAAAEQDDAEQVAAQKELKEKMAALPLLETPPPTLLESDGKPARQAPSDRQSHAELDLIGRTEVQLKKMDIQLQDEQLKKLRALSSRYDFLATAPGEERQALRRKYMTEIFETILTPEQQKLVREKRGF